MNQLIIDSLPRFQSDDLRVISVVCLALIGDVSWHVNWQPPATRTLIELFTLEV